MPTIWSIYSKHAGCVLRLLNRTDCYVVALSTELVAVHVWNAPDQWHNWRVAGKGAARGGAEGAQAPPLAIRILMFIFFVFHQHCTASRDRVHCKMLFGSPTGVATHSLSNQTVTNFRDLRNIEAAFFIPACFVLPYITRAGCCRALPVWKHAWHLNYQQCRLMCSFYVTKLGSS